MMVSKMHRIGLPANAVTSLAVMLCCCCGARTIQLARVKYGGGGDWYANPTGLPNLIEAANERTTLRIETEPAVLQPASEAIFDTPVLFITGHGQIAFSDQGMKNMRKYLLNGGFLHVDDNYGLDEHFRPLVKRLFPAKELVELPFDHPIYHCFHDFENGLPKIHEHHGGPPHGYGIIHEGRVVLFYSYNTDINDGWEDADVHNDPADKREAAIRMGINIIVYALTH